jgi:hypothetical protein
VASREDLVSRANPRTGPELVAALGEALPGWNVELGWAITSLAGQRLREHRSAAEVEGLGSLLPYLRMNVAVGADDRRPA